MLVRARRLVCAQTCKNSWSSIGYANLAATFPTDSGEPDWDLIRKRTPNDIVPCIWHGVRRPRAALYPSGDAS